MASTLFLVHWKPEHGLPVTQGSFGTVDAAIAHIQALAAERTSTGEWLVVSAPAELGADRRDVLLRSATGAVESFFISEHQAEAGGAARAKGTDTASIPRVSAAARSGEAAAPADAQWQRRYRLQES